MSTTGSVQRFGHSHAHLGELMLELAELLRDDVFAATPEARVALAQLAAELRDELLEHFANEEEGLFPFVRDQVLALRATVERLQAAHDTICGALVRFAFLAEREGEPSSEALLAYERFQVAYGAHAREESDLLDQLEQALTLKQQSELETLLRGLG